ncbi:MAG: hypothetical protein FWE09_08590 [Treponema sp.]|nr:hypothetical protein [Treponema sp.]
MFLAMTIERIVEIPADRRITFDVPQGIPTGKATLIIRFPAHADGQTDGAFPPEAKGEIDSEAFRLALGRAYGAWKDNPWASHIEDVGAMRDEWERPNPWNAGKTTERPD